MEFSFFVLFFAILVFIGQPMKIQTGNKGREKGVTYNKGPWPELAMLHAL